MEVMELNRQALDSVEGWLSEAAIVYTQALIALQRQNNWVSGILELGVFKGKYLSLLAQQVSGFGVPVVGVDAFLQRHGVKLAQPDKEYAEQMILKAIRSVSGSADNVTLIGGYTTEVSLDRLRDLCPEGYSFISVDAGHDSEDVEYDSRVADALLGDKGVVAFDDIYNAVCPGVAEGFVRYMIGSGQRLAPFATCGNKVFACRPAMHPRYYDFSKRLARNVNVEAPILARTLEQLTANEENHWSPRLFGHEVIPFL
jgi:hypothetical protein